MYELSLRCLFCLSCLFFVCLFLLDVIILSQICWITQQYVEIVPGSQNSHVVGVGFGSGK